MPIPFQSSVSRPGLYRAATFRPAESLPLVFTVTGGVITQQVGSR